MKFTLINHEKQTEEVVDTPFTIKQWMSVHFGSWGFYKVTQVNKKEYEITDKFSGELAYTVKGGR
jgi:hypothetical protein